MSKAQALMDIACRIAGEDVRENYPPTTVGAIDALTDALAGSDIDVEGMSVTQAITAMGDHIGKGGGSGEVVVDVGDLPIATDDDIDALFG